MGDKQELCSLAQSVADAIAERDSLAKENVELKQQIAELRSLLESCRDRFDYLRSQYDCDNYCISAMNEIDKALLVCAEPIEKECKHEPEIIKTQPDSRGMYQKAWLRHCKHCGKRLTPRWEVIE